MKKNIARAAIRGLIFSAYLLFLRYLGGYYSFDQGAWISITRDFVLDFFLLGLVFVFVGRWWQPVHLKREDDNPFRAAEVQQTEPGTVPELLVRDALRSLGIGVIITVSCARLGLTPMVFDLSPLPRMLISYAIYTPILFCALFLSDWLCSLLEKAKPKHST